MQELIAQSKELMNSIEHSMEMQKSVIEREHETYTLSFMQICLCLQRFLSSLDIPAVRIAISKASSENQLKLLDFMRNLTTAPFVDGWPGYSSAALAATPSFLQDRVELRTVSEHTFNLVSGRPVAIPLCDDSEGALKKNTTFKDVRNLCFRLMANPLIQRSLGMESLPISTASSVNEEHAPSVHEEPVEQGTSQPFEYDEKPFEKQSDVQLNTMTDHTSSGDHFVEVSNEPIVDQVIKPLNSTFNFLQVRN